MAEMFKYSAQAPLVFKSTDTRLKEAGEDARESASRSGDRRKGGEETPSMRDRESIRAIAFGEALSVTRPVIRASQRAAKETALLFIISGAVAVLFLSARRWLYVMMVPLYYLLVQSSMHTEFRYTLPMHYFVFVFAAATWVLIGHAALVGAKRLARLRDKDRTGESAAAA
jgi:hypothetical protein